MKGRTHTYESKFRELQEEPFLGGFLGGEGLHVMVVARLCNNIIL